MAPDKPSCQVESRGFTQWSLACWVRQVVSRTSCTSGAWTQLITVAWGGIAAAFSVAMAVRLFPRCSQWSRPMLATATTGRHGWAVVASSRPPSPTSSTSRSQACRWNSKKAEVTSSSNGVSRCRSFRGLSACNWVRSVSAAMGFPLIRMRSHQLTRWGEVVTPQRRPAAQRADSRKLTMEPFPLVPST